MIDPEDLDPDEVDLNMPDGWTTFLDKWEGRIYYPHFAKRGYSKALALNSWLAMQILVRMDELLDDRSKD